VSAMAIEYTISHADGFFRMLIVVSTAACKDQTQQSDDQPQQCGWPHDQASHSGLLEPRGASTVRKAPGVRDKTTWSVKP